MATRFRDSVRGEAVSGGVGDFRFKGLDHVVEVHEALGDHTSVDATDEWRDLLDAALQPFRLRAFRPAPGEFREVLRLRPHDGPSHL